MTLDASLQVRIESEMLEDLKASAREGERSLGAEARRRLKYHPYGALLRGGYGANLANEMLEQHLDGHDRPALVENLAVGDICTYPPGSDSIFALASITQAADGELVYKLRPVAGDGKPRSLEEGTFVEAVSRLDVRLPVRFLQPSDFELKVLTCLAGGAKDTEALFRLAHRRRDFDVQQQRVSRVQIGPFVGRLLLHLVPAELVELHGDPLAGGIWVLSERGRALAQHLRIGG